MRVAFVLRVVVRGFLPDGVRRVADDDADGGGLLIHDARGVPGEDAGEVVVGVAVFAELERVGQADAVEAGVVLAADEVVERVLDVDAGDVVGEQDDLVGVELLRVFAPEVGGAQDAGLQQAREERAGAGERVEDVDVRLRQAAAEFFFQHVVDAVQDEVDDLDGRVDDAELADGLRQGGLEEVVVELDDDALAAFGVFDAFAAHAHGVVEFLEALQVFFEAVVVEQREDLLHGAGDGVVLGKGIIREQRLEDGTRDDVLREHLDGVVFGDVGVDVAVQAVHEGLERGAVRVVGRDELRDALLVAGGDAGDVFRPLFPVEARADFLHHARVDRALELVEIERRLLVAAAGARVAGFFRAVGVVARVFVVGDEDVRVVGFVLLQVDLVDGGVEAVVVRAQGVQHGPDDAERLVVLERVLGAGVRRDDDGDDDVAVAFAGRGAHDAADGLDDVDLRFARGEEEHGVERGDVDALREAADVREDAAFVLGSRAVGVFQPAELFVAARRAHRAVDVVGADGDDARALLRRQGVVVEVFVAVENLGGLFRGFDARAEGERRVHGLRVDVGEVARLGDHALREGVDAADELARVVRLDFLVGVGDGGLQRGRNLVVADGEDEHLVIAEESLGDGAAEVDAEKFFAVDGGIVHRAEEDVLLGGFLLRVVAVEARRGGHVEALLALDECVVVDFRERRAFLVFFLDARRAVRLVADDEVKDVRVGGFFLGRGRGEEVRLRLVDDVDGLVGGKDDRQAAFLRRRYPLRPLRGHQPRGHKRPHRR